MGFPCYMYHETKAPDGQRFNKSEELESAGSGWVDTPASFGKKQEPKKLEPEPEPSEPQYDPDDVAKMREEAKALGVKSCHNMKPETLIAKIAEAKEELAKEDEE